MKLSEVFRGNVEAFDHLKRSKCEFRNTLTPMSYRWGQFIGVKMHFAEIAPNSVAYTFWEDIIQPNNEVIEFTKVNK